MVPVFTGGIFALVGVVMLAWQLYIASWPATTGTLLLAEVKEVPMDASPKGGGPSYCPQVHYTYAVAGQTYQGSNYTVWEGSGPASWAQRTVESLWQQQRTRGHIAVYYKPGNPSRSALTKSDLPGMMGWVFFPFGSVFVFLGLSGISASTRRRVVFKALMGGSGVGAALGIAALIAVTTMGWYLTPWIEIALGACLVVGYFLSHRHPEYVHADEMSRVHPTASQPARPNIAVVPPQGLSTLKAGTSPMGGGRALRIAVVVGLVPFVLFGSYGIFVEKFFGDDSFFNPGAGAISFFGGFGLFFGLVVGIPTFLVARRLPPLSDLFKAATDAYSNSYSDFAEKVNGEVEPQKSPAGIPGLGRLSLPGGSLSLPTAVAFTHQGTRVRFEVVTTGTGKGATSYHRLTFALPHPTSFRCQVYPKGLLSQLGVRLGMPAVELGWKLFDDMFVVKANDEVEARSLLTREVQDGILRLKQWLLETPALAQNSGVELTLEQTLLRVRLGGTLLSAEDFRIFYDHVGGIYDEVIRYLPAAVGGPAGASTEEEFGGSPSKVRNRRTRPIAPGFLALLVANSLFGGVHFVDHWTDAQRNEYLRRSTGFHTVVIAISPSGERSWKVSQNYLVFHSRSSSGSLVESAPDGGRLRYGWSFGWGHFGPEDDVLRPQGAVLQPELPSPASRPRPELTIGAGEIRLDGTVVAVDPPQRTFVLSVSSFTLPGGRTRRFPLPKPKHILVDDGTVLHAKGNPERKMVLTEFRRQDFVAVIGRDTGSGMALQAREAAAVRN